MASACLTASKQAQSYRGVDVPFPKFIILQGDNPSPDEILRRAQEALRREGG
jgi:hypothetical protein